MSANKYAPHLLVIPEDDANRQIVNGFRNHPEVNSHQIHVEPVARGWRNVLSAFEGNHVEAMGRLPQRYVLLLIDFDGNEGRIEVAKARIPPNVEDRVFVLGCMTEPEALSSATRQTKEEIGEGLARACIGGGESACESLWEHAMLRHNRDELERMNNTICPHLRA